MTRGMYHEALPNEIKELGEIDGATLDTNYETHSSGILFKLSYRGEEFMIDKRRDFETQEDVIGTLLSDSDKARELIEISDYELDTENYSRPVIVR